MSLPSLPIHTNPFALSITPGSAFAHPSAASLSRLHVHSSNVPTRLSNQPRTIACLDKGLFHSSKPNFTPKGWLLESVVVHSSPLNDFFGNLFGDDNKEKELKSEEGRDNDTGSNDDELSLSSFQQELAKRQGGGSIASENNDDENISATNIATATKEESGEGISETESDGTEEEEEFDGYAMRDAIYAKYGECFDVEFQRVDSYGFRSVYLNILPFKLGGRRFRHQTEYDYLCHLQAVVEILVKYNQLDYVLAQLSETTKKPRAGTSPLIAVPLRLDLTSEQVDKILG